MSYDIHLATVKPTEGLCCVVSFHDSGSDEHTKFFLLVEPR